MKKITAKDRILEAAINRFVTDGYLATSVDDILRDAGVSKGAFYHAFKSKEAMGLEALDLFYHQGMTILASGEYIHEKDPVKRAIGFVRYTEENAPAFWEHGCMMGSFAVDLSPKLPSFKKRLTTIFSEMHGRISAIFLPFTEAIEGKTPAAENLADQYLHTLYGAITMGQAYGDPARTRTGIRIFREYLENLAA